MKAGRQSAGTRQALAIMAVQVGITLLAALIMAVMFEGRAAWSALVGGGISITTTACFATRVFAADGRDLRKVVRAFYVGEVQKIALTALLFAVAIKLLNVEFLPMFGTFMATLLAFWFALLPALGAGGGPKTKKTG